MAHLTHPETFELVHFVIGCFSWRDHTAEGLEAAFRTRVEAWIPTPCVEAGLDLDALGLLLVVDGASANKFDGLQLTVLTCVNHRLDTLIKHVLDPTLPDPSPAATAIQELVEPQLHLSQIVRGSSKITCVACGEGHAVG